MQLTVVSYVRYYVSKMCELGHTIVHWATCVMKAILTQITSYTDETVHCMTFVEHTASTIDLVTVLGCLNVETLEGTLVVREYQYLHII